LGAYLRFINLVAPAGKFFFAVAALANCHNMTSFKLFLF
jgi:hypothetical protein